MQILRLACRWLCMSNYSVENIPRGVLRKLVHRILSNYHIDLSDFLSAALSSIDIATATPHYSVLQMKKASIVNVSAT